MSLGGQPGAPKAFGASLRELAAAGHSPVVLQDCLRWLALRGLTAPRLFAGPRAGDKRKLLALRHLYDTGRRPLRSKSCRDKDPHLVASLLLLWLGSLPEPLFPAALVPELAESQQSDYYEERLASVRGLLKRADPYVVEALFPLFELLHHYWINQADRDSSLQELGRLLAPAVFGTPRQHGLPAADGGLLSDTVEMLISEYRPLFTQPFNLRRYEADAARQAAAEAARAEAAGMPSSPLLTPIRCERLSVMVPEGLGSPFGDCCATPLAAESPVSAFLAAAIEQAAGAGPSPSQPAAAAQPGYTSVAVVPLVGGSPRGLSALQTAPPPAPHSPLGAHRYHPLEADALLEETFSSLLESTVSGMLFGGDLLAAEAAQAAPAPTAALGLTCSAGCRPLSAGSGLAGEDADMQPASPVAVLPEPASDGGDTSDGSDCDTVPAGKSPFAWQRAAAAGLAMC